MYTNSNDVLISKNIAQQIRVRRKLRGYSATDLAQKTDLSAMTIYSYEHGKTMPNIGNLGALARALGCNPLDLISDTITIKLGEY